ncbi:DUF2024 family protein [Alcaligenes sp. SDU_A2]|uniref:DUF2024 family protein n=1 Tax=Alcaligenes sp. SDU_A2 TaxID=3136634 RepID=UPI002C67609C|nr:DUF2024 family protein [Alcaligenes sp.]HRL27685.1 DUF2024 family protein [Alcaligenes sp.]
MKIAVFDTYVRRADGRRMHFDILVSEQGDRTVPQTVLEYGHRYLAAKGIPADSLTTRECRFCHVETASPQVEAEIKRIGFAIIELEHCD